MRYNAVPSVEFQQMFRRNFTSSTLKTEVQYLSEVGGLSRDLYYVSQETDIFNSAFIKSRCLLSDASIQNSQKKKKIGVFYIFNARNLIEVTTAHTSNIPSTVVHSAFCFTNSYDSMTSFANVWASARR
jgi:hypothetical protein